MPSPVDISQAQALLREGLPPGEVAERLSVSLRTLQRAFTLADLPSPRAWQHAEIGSQAEGVSPVVSFRLQEFAALETAAAGANKRPNEYARDVLKKHLRRKK